MRAVLAVLLVAVNLLASSGTSTAAPVRDALAKYAVLISVDGMRTTYLHDPALAPRTPNLQAIIQQGVLADGAYSVLPAQTFPAHTSMITGVNPNDHGIVINCEDTWRNVAGPKPQSDCDHHYFYRDIRKETIFDALVKKGREVAGVDWPVTVGMPAVCVYPGNDDSPDNFQEAEFLYETLKCDTVLRHFPNASYLWDVTDTERGNIGIDILKDRQPDLLALHYNDLDGNQHGYGYMSPEAIATLETIDASIGQVFLTLEQLGIRNETLVIITSDHGFCNITATINPQILFSSLNLIPDTVLPYVGSTAGIEPVFLSPTATPDGVARLDAALALLTSIPEYNVRKIWTKEELAQAGGYLNAYVGIEYNIGFDFQNHQTGNVYQVPPDMLGQHGYPPQREEMFASFLAVGPGVKQGATVGMVSLVDIAPTLAYALGVPFPTNIAGQVLGEIFEDGQF